MIELIRNGRVIERHFPEDTAVTPAPLPGAVKCRFRYGWGPWAALNLGRIADWDVDLHLTGARFTSALPCFQTAPFDAERRDHLRVVSPTHLHLQSHTSRVGSFAEDPTKAVILGIDAAKPDAVLTVTLRSPAKMSITAKLTELQHDNEVHFTGPFTSESFLIERLVGPSESAAKIRWQDSRPNQADSDWYYVRVLQHNNHMAWSSPIWVG